MIRRTTRRTVRPAGDWWLAATLTACVASGILVAQPADRATLAERVARLGRDASWSRVAIIPVAFRTYHPQGLVKIGERFYLSSVEVREAPRRTAKADGRETRTTGEGTGHLFEMDANGRLLRSITLGEGTIYHPGGIDFDGRYIWVAVAEYRPDSRSIVYRVDPRTMTATEVFRFADHLGAVVHDATGPALHAVSWGSRRFYRWPLDERGQPIDAGAPRRAVNPSHYVDYQDCQQAGARRMLCTGLAEMTSAPGAPFILGGLDLVDLEHGRPLHQVPVVLFAGQGVAMTRNPSWFEATAAGLRAYFVPEDDSSTVYVYEVTGR